MNVPGATVPLAAGRPAVSLSNGLSVENTRKSMNRMLLGSLALFVVLTSGCRHDREPLSQKRPASGNKAKDAQATTGLVPGLEACQAVLAPVTSEDAGALDRQIGAAQEAVRANRQPQAALERLGWLWVAKARASFDDGYYKLAEQCATCLESRWPGDADAMLLRGHVLHNTHRFKEAEPIARHLVSRRGAPFDHGLLGDVLMELGH